MPNYETLILLPPEIEGEALEARVGGLKKIIENAGAVEIRENRIGRKRLAYRVAKKEAGVYVAFEYAGPSDAPEKVRRAFAIDEGIIRSKTVFLLAAPAVA